MFVFPHWLKPLLFCAALIGAYTYGLHMQDKSCQLEKLKIDRIQAMALQAQYEQALKAQDELVAELEAAKSKVKIVRAKVKVYVQPETDLVCGPSVGVVSMFNNARRPDLPQSSPATVEEGRVPSGYSATDFNDTNLDAVERYNALMVEHNKLVELLTNDAN
mgnify:FL=1